MKTMIRVPGESSGFNCISGDVLGATSGFPLYKVKNLYVRTRIRWADTASDFYMCVYPYMRMRSCIPVSNIQKMALSTLQARQLQMQNEDLLIILGTYRILGQQKRKNAKRRHRWWGSCENRYPIRLKKSDSHSHAQTHSYKCIWISALYIFEF